VHAYLKSAVNFVAAPGWETFVSSRVSSEPPAHEHHSSGRSLSDRAHAHAHANAHHHSHGHGHGRDHGPTRHRRDLPSAAPVRLERVTDPSTCFSPAVPVSVSGLSIDVSAGVQLALMFDNNDRNVRLLLPVDVTLTWSS
jgi:hypothetical protein